MSRSSLVLKCASFAAYAAAALSAAFSGPAPTTAPGSFRFTEVTERSGIHFRHNAGKAGQKFLPETMGPGVALFDYNNDGKLDISSMGVTGVRKVAKHRARSTAITVTAPSRMGDGGKRARYFHVWTRRIRSRLR